jgi:hypothetical protein
VEDEAGLDSSVGEEQVAVELREVLAMAHAAQYRPVA